MRIVHYDLSGYDRADSSAFDIEVEKLGFPRSKGVFFTPSRDDGGEWVFAPISSSLGEEQLTSLIEAGKVWLADAFIANQVITGESLEVWDGVICEHTPPEPSIKGYMASLKKALSLEEVEKAIKKGSPYWHAWVSESGEGQDLYSALVEACYLEVIVFGMRKYEVPRLRYIGDESAAEREFKYADYETFRAFEELKALKGKI